MYVFKNGKVIYEGFKNISKLVLHEFSRDFPNTVLKFKEKRLAIQEKKQSEKINVLAIKNKYLKIFNKKSRVI